MKSNIKIIKKFVNSVISSKDISNENDRFVKYTKYKYSKFNFQNEISKKIS